MTRAAAALCALCIQVFATGCVIRTDMAKAFDAAHPDASFSQVKEVSRAPYIGQGGSKTDAYRQFGQTFCDFILVTTNNEVKQAAAFLSANAWSCFAHLRWQKDRKTAANYSFDYAESKALLALLSFIHSTGATIQDVHSNDIQRKLLPLTPNLIEIYRTTPGAEDYLRTAIKTCFPKLKLSRENGLREMTSDVYRTCLVTSDPGQPLRAAFKKAIQADKKTAELARKRQEAKRRAAIEALQKAADAEVQAGKCSTESFSSLSDGARHYDRMLSGAKYLNSKETFVLSAEPHQFAFKGSHMGGNWVFVQSNLPVELTVIDHNGNEIIKQAWIQVEGSNSFHSPGPSFGDSAEVHASPGKPLTVSISGSGCAMMTIYAFKPQ